MLEEQFIPYDEALALKELGFVKECFTYFLNGIIQPILNPKDYSYFKEMSEINSNILKYENVLAPTYQQAFDWFRETHGYFSSPTQRNTLTKTEYDWTIHNQITDEKFIIKFVGYFDTYQEARLACIQLLIEMVNNIRL